MTSLPTELLLEILNQALAPEHFDTVVIQQTPRRRQRLYGPCDAYLITERARFNLRQVSRLFKDLIDAYSSLSSPKHWFTCHIDTLTQMPAEWSL